MNLSMMNSARRRAVLRDYGLDHPLSEGMLATIAFAITVRALTKSWGAPPQSLRIASSRWRMLLGLLIGLPPP